MMRHYSIPLESSREWKDALEGIAHSFAFTRENCYAMHLTTGYKTFLGVFEQDDKKIVCPLSEREFHGYKDIVTPYGFSGFAGNGDLEEFPKYFREFARNKGYVCGYLSLNPAFSKSSYFDAADGYETTSLYFLNLNSTLTELYENLDANRRRQIVNYKKIETDFIYDRAVLKNFFIDNYNDFLIRINASRANYFEQKTLEYICELENVFMVGVGKSDCIKAVYIFAYTPYIGDCLFNVATPEGRSYSPVLLWAGLKFLKSKRIPLLNLGGGISEDDNVAQSKGRYGAYKLPFINLKQIYNPETYKDLCLKNGADDNDKSGYFPAYRKVKLN